MVKQARASQTIADDFHIYRGKSIVRITFLSQRKRFFVAFFVKSNPNFPVYRYIIYGLEIEGETRKTETKNLTP